MLGYTLEEGICGDRGVLWARGSVFPEGLARGFTPRNVCINVFAARRLNGLIRAGAFAERRVAFVPGVYRKTSVVRSSLKYVIMHNLNKIGQSAAKL